MVSLWLINWQCLDFKSYTRDYDVVFVDGNPRYLSHFFLASYLRIFASRKVVLWTMVHTYTANPITGWIRLAWTRFFKKVLVYTDYEAELLKNSGYKGVCIGMNNGLDQSAIDKVREDWNEESLSVWKQQMKLSRKRVILSCTRLIRKNKLDEFMRQFAQLGAKYSDILWVVIGDGEERERLEELARELSLTNAVRFMGSIFEEAELAPWFLSAEVCVHPGAIGLTLLHSLGYGLPVLTHDERKYHGPEFAAITNRENSYTYKYGDYDSLRFELCSILENKRGLKKCKINALYTARNIYNTDVMVDRFLKLVNEAK